MNATTIIAWTADADYWCDECAEVAYGPDSPDRVDNEGNEVHPIFASDEWWDVTSGEAETLNCGQCGAELASADAID